MTDTSRHAHPVSGPLLDWWYVHAGYVGFKDGTSKAWDAPLGIEIEAQPAAKSDPIMVPDRPWERDGLGSVGSFYHQDGRYVMYYRAEPGGLCKAESDDGINWTKPELGAVEFEGSKRNNIVGDYYRVFEDPAASPAERFKAVGGEGGMYLRERDREGNLVKLTVDEEAVARMGGPENPSRNDILQLQELLKEDYQGRWGQLKAFLTGAVSPDGLHWTDLEKPLLEEFVDGDNVVFYDEKLGKYVGYLRFHVAGRRCVGRSESDDFRTFTPEQLMVLTDPQDPPDTSFYNHGYTRYPGRDDLHLMFLSLYSQSKATKDIQLAVSHDGINWNRPDRETPLISNYAEGPGHGAMLYVAPGLLQMPDGRYAALYWGRGAEKSRQRRVGAFAPAPGAVGEGSPGRHTGPRLRVLHLATGTLPGSRGLPRLHRSPSPRPLSAAAGSRRAAAPAQAQLQDRDRRLDSRRADYPPGPQAPSFGGAAGDPGIQLRGLRRAAGRCHRRGREVEREGQYRLTLGYSGGPHRNVQSYAFSFSL